MKANRRLTGLLPMLLVGIFAVIAAIFTAATPSAATVVSMTKDVCKRCHGTDDAVITSWHHVIRAATNSNCMMCHKTVSDGTGGYVLEVQRDCTVCHTPGYHTTPDGTLANRHHAIRNANDYGCLHCHPIVQDQYGNNEVTKTADCFFCHTDGMLRPWREINHLTNLPTPTSADTAATVTNVTAQFYDTIEYNALEIVHTTTDKAFSVRFDKDAATISKITLGFYVFELANAAKGGTIRIYPYLFDGVTVDTSTFLDFKVSMTGWAQCDVTNLAMKMTGFTWMKFRVTAVNTPIMISENQYQMTRLDTVATNKIPIAEAGPDQLVNVGDTVTFIGGSSYDPDGTIASYRWDFGDGTIAGGAVASHVYTAPGVYFVALKVTDNLGATAEDYAFVNIKAPSLPPNQPPIANAGPDFTGTAGQPIVFSGAASSDPDGQIYSWDWRFDDGTSASGETVTKIYTAPGTYVSTLTVTDTKGAIATDTVVVIVKAPTPTNVVPVANAGPDSYAAVGATVSFSGAASSDANGTITSYNWDFGDGTTGTGVSATKIYSAAGIYVATLTVTDNAGAMATDTVTITIHDVIQPNQPPIANAGSEVTTAVGKTVTFSGAGSTDTDGSIASYSWSFGDGTSATGATVSKSYNTAGTFTVVLTVTDDLGATDTATAVVTVNTNAPTANAGPDVSVVTGTAATFSGAASTDSDGTIASYSWNFGDGTTASGASATKTYNTAGTYTVTLTVTDNLGAKGTDTVLVTVAANKPPIASAGPDKTATVNKAVSFSAAASSDPDGTIASYSWNFGNGSTGTGPSVTKTYTSTGTYTVTLTVTDNLGAKSTDTAIVTVVTNQSPVANAGPDVTATTGQTLSFSGAGSTDPDGTISSYSWNFGDGSSTRTGVSTTKSYSAAGTYTVTLTVTDNGGKTATDTAIVTVTASNKPPVANAGADVTAAPGQTLTFSGAASSDPDGTIASYAWTFGDGTSDTGVSVAKSFTTAGTYTVTLTVTDNAGAKTTDTAVVTVTAASAYISADLGQQIANLSSRTYGDTSGTINDITTKLRDNVLTDTYRVDSSNAVSMKVNKDANTTTQVILRVYVSSISGSQTLRIYAYNSNGTSLNTTSGSYVDKSVSGTGWKEIDVTSIAAKMRGFGWMKFRITNSNSVRVAEGNFTIR